MIEADDAISAAGSNTITNFGTIDGALYPKILGSGNRLDAEAGSRIEGTVAAGGALVDVVSGVASMTALNAPGTLEGPGPCR